MDRNKDDASNKKTVGQAAYTFYQYLVDRHGRSCARRMFLASPVSNRTICLKDEHNNYLASIGRVGGEAGDQNSGVKPMEVDQEELPSSGQLSGYLNTSTCKPDHKPKIPAPLSEDHTHLDGYINNGQASNPVSRAPSAYALMQPLAGTSTNSGISPNASDMMFKLGQGKSAGGGDPFNFGERGESKTTPTGGINISVRPRRSASKRSEWEVA